MTKRNINYLDKGLLESESPKVWVITRNGLSQQCNHQRYTTKKIKRLVVQQKNYCVIPGKITLIQDLMSVHLNSD